MPATIDPPRFGKRDTIIVDLDTTVLSKLKCVVDNEPIPYARAISAVAKHQKPLYCSNKCMRGTQTRRFRQSKANT
jgi:hypothetical protein